MQQKKNKPTTLRRLIRIVKAAAWVLFVAAFFFFAFFGSEVISETQHISAALKNRVGAALNRQGVLFYADHDAAIPTDLISGGRFSLWDSPKVKGRYGYARRIKSDSSNASLLPAPSPFLRGAHLSEFSLSLWIRPEEGKAGRQELFFTHKSDDRLTLFLENGKLYCELFDTIHHSSLLLESGFTPSPKKYTHVALSLSKKDITLYVNGCPTSREAITEDMLYTPLPMSFAAQNHSPYFGDIDEYALFAKPLTPAEVKKLAASRVSLAFHKAPLYAFAQCTAARLAEALRETYRILDRITPSLTTSSVINNRLPTLSVWMSQNDERHFKNAHEKSLANGYRTNKAASFRKVHITINKKRYPISLALDDCYDNPLFRAKRPSYLLHDEHHVFTSNPNGLVKLYPPELHTHFHPEAPYLLPHNSQLIRLTIDNNFKGIYIVEDFDQIGAAYLAHGPHDLPHALHFNSLLPKASMLLPGVDNDALYRQKTALYRSDNLFPWSNSEIKHREKKLREFHRHFNFALQCPSLVHPSDILGTNPALLYITDKLTLPEKTASGEALQWTSSDEELVSATGEVTRPAGSEHKIVTLTASAAGTKQDFRLRVIASAPTLPTLFLNVDSPVRKDMRRDFTATVIATNSATLHLKGTGDQKSGIRHRGNTSYTKAAKRSLTLEFDEAVVWPGSTNAVHHVLIYSGYADPTSLRNKVSFDAFNRVAAAAANPYPMVAPTISFIEYFVNGEYFGIAETSHRMRDLLPPETLSYKVRARSSLWATPSTRMVECQSTHRHELYPYRPLEELFTFTAKSSRDDFIASAADKFYAENVIDYYLLLNFTQNSDAILNNQYIVRAKDDTRFTIIPWDYDKTFFPTGRILSNHLTSRFLREVPGVKEATKARWLALRQSVMSDEAILSRLEEDIRLLAPYMNEEYALQQPLGFDGTFDEAVNELKLSIRQNLRRLDEHFQ